MRRFATGLLALLLLCGSWLALRPGAAQEAPQQTLYVSGLQIGRGTSAIVRLRNIDPDTEGSTLFDYRILDPAAGQVVIPTTVTAGARIRPGEILELDLNEIVSAWRVANAFGPYDGPVTFQAQVSPDLNVDFGSRNIAAEAVQRIRRATYGVVAEWKDN